MAVAVRGKRKAWFVRRISFHLDALHRPVRFTRRWRWLGDPNNDFQINSGGFKDEARVCPNPHRIRRNYSLYLPALQLRHFPSLGRRSRGPPRPPTLAINGSTVKSDLNGLVANYTGNFFAFQTYFESFNMSPILPHTIFSHPDPPVHGAHFGTGILPCGLRRWLTRSGTTCKTGMSGTNLRTEEAPSK